MDMSIFLVYTFCFKSHINFFKANGSHTSSFNDGTKLKNSGPTLSATTRIIFSAVVVVATDIVSKQTRHMGLPLNSVKRYSHLD